MARTLGHAHALIPLPGGLRLTRPASISAGLLLGGRFLSKLGKIS